MTNLKSMKFLMYFDLTLCGLNAYVGAAALIRGDWFWTAVGIGLSLLMLYNYNRRKEIIKAIENNGNDRDRTISGR